MKIVNDRHWLWIAFTENSTVLYGCLVHVVDHWAALADQDKDATIQLGENHFSILQVLLESAEAKQIADSIATQSIIDLSGLGGPKIRLSSSRHRLLSGFGRFNRPVQTYICEKYLELPDDAWRAALIFLKRSLGIDFGQASDRLCAFDIFDQPELARTDDIIRLQVDREEDGDTKAYPERLTLSHVKPAEAPATVHLELQLGDECVFSKLFLLEPGEKTAVQAVCFDHYRMSVFDGGGLLTQFEEYPLLLRMGLNMSMLGSTRTVDDRLSRSAQGLGAEQRDRASKVRTRSTNRSLVGVENVTFDVHQTRMRALMKRLVSPIGKDRWFPRGVTHEINVIAHLNTLLDGARAKACTIVDPWFGVDTLKRIITRIESLDVSLTVITSLGTKDPETNKLNPHLLTELQDILDDYRRDRTPSAAHRLRVVNLIDGTEQAFHDRYLLLTLHEGEKEVYLLSNSLNRMAGKWPFCISKLDPAAAYDAARYIDGLAAGRDISGSTQPTVNFQWSSNEGR